MRSTLLLDDDAIAAEALQKLLAFSGFHVDVAYTAESSLRMAATTLYDLAILDLNVKSEHSEFPDIANGLDTVRQLRAARFDSPIVVFTFFEGALYETASLAAGADAYILKTIEVPELLSHLERQLRRYERKRRKRC